MSGCISVSGEIGIHKTCDHFLGKAWHDLGSLLMLVALLKSQQQKYLESTPRRTMKDGKRNGKDAHYSRNRIRASIAWNAQSYET